MKRRFACVERLWHAGEQGSPDDLAVLDQHLGPDRRRPRLLTQAIIDTTFDQLAGARKVC